MPPVCSTLHPATFLFRQLCKYLRAIFHIKRQAPGRSRRRKRLSGNKNCRKGQKTCANCDQSLWQAQEGEAEYEEKARASCITFLGPRALLRQPCPCVTSAQESGGAKGKRKLSNRIGQEKHPRARTGTGTNGPRTGKLQHICNCR